MGHLLVFYGFLVLSFGAFSLFNAVFGALKIKDEFRQTYLLFYGSFTISVLLYSIREYFQQNIPNPPSIIIQFWAGIDTFFDLAIIITAILFFHTLYNIPYRKKFNLFISMGSIAALILFTLSAINGIEEALRQVFLSISLFYYQLCFAYIILLNLICIWRVRGKTQRFFSYGLFLFALVGYLESMGILPQLVTGEGLLEEWTAPRAFYLSTLPYFLWTIISTIVLWNPYHPTGKEIDIQDFLRRFNITPREHDVLILLLKGKSNQEIADALFISLQTVKTHVHHMYEKTDTGSRMDLAAVVQSLS
jgi:DNA-binding CsgD family transcriptional regulator